MLSPDEERRRRKEPGGDESTQEVVLEYPREANRRKASGAGNYKAHCLGCDHDSASLGLCPGQVGIGKADSSRVDGIIGDGGRLMTVQRRVAEQ